MSHDELTINIWQKTPQLEEISNYDSLKNHQKNTQPFSSSLDTSYRTFQPAIQKNDYTAVNHNLFEKASRR